MLNASRPPVCLVSCVCVLCVPLVSSLARERPADRRRRRPRAGDGRRLHRRRRRCDGVVVEPGRPGRRRLLQRPPRVRHAPRAADRPRLRPATPRGPRADTRSFAVAFPALGLSYYRLRISEIQPQTSTGTTPGVRQDQGGATEVRLRSLVLNQFGATVGQSLGSHLVIASTLKLVHGGAVSQVQPAADGSLDAATGLDPPGETHAGLDIGAMAVLGRARFGVMVRNVTRAGVRRRRRCAFTLRRQARVGAALTLGTRGVDRRGDARGRRRSDDDADGARRRAARGGGRRGCGLAADGSGVRGGVSANTIGDRRPALSGGAERRR